MADKLDEILKEVSAMRKQQSHDSIRAQRIERVLIGDPKFNQKGLVHEVKYHSEFIEKGKLRTAKQAGIIIGITFVFTMAIELIKLKYGS